LKYETQNFEESLYKVVSEDNSETAFVPNNTSNTQKRENLVYNVMKKIEDYTTFANDNADLDKINFQQNINS